MRRAENNHIEQPSLDQEKHNSNNDNSQKRADNMPPQFFQVFQECHFLLGLPYTVNVYLVECHSLCA
jgi:hypothetical protein